MEFTRTNLKEIREEIVSVLEVVAENHDINFNLGNITFTPEKFTVKLTAISTKAADGSVLTEQAQAYLDIQKFKESIGQPIKNLGDIFIFQGEEFEIIGWKSRARKYPLIGKNVKTGKRFTFQEHNANK